MYYFLFIVVISMVINSVSCCSKNNNADYKCLDDSPVFDRPSIDREGFNTTKWCITPLLWINGNYDPVSVCLQNNFSIISAPLNQPEMDFIVQKTENLMFEKGLVAQNWTLFTDGVRKVECRPPNSCPLNETYYNYAFPIDPTYMTTHWMPGQPNPKTSGNLDEDYIGFNQDGLFRTVFDTTEDSPILGADGKPEYTFNGVFCTYPANKK